MPLDIKICGLRTAETIDAAIAGGASHVGFIFFPRSPRNVTPEQAGHLRARARGAAQAVAVTVDATDDELDRIVAAMAPDVLQFHGSESPARVAAAKARWGVPVMKALPVADAADLRAADPFRGIADRLLFDAKPPRDADLPGGNGLAFDWRLLEGRHDDYMLSGGLDPRNVGDAIRLLRPPGIDVSSGVESAPGVKDVGLIRAFLDAAKAATAA